MSFKRVFKSFKEFWRVERVLERLRKFDSLRDFENLRVFNNFQEFLRVFMDPVSSCPESWSPTLVLEIDERGSHV